MVYVEIKNMARKYSAWRRKELAKQNEPGRDSGNPGNPSIGAPPKNIPTWKEWKSIADKATKVLKKNARNGIPLTFDKEIWKTLKPFLEYLFNGKCAYCEGCFRAGSYLDVEHYRPKAEVTHDRRRGSIVKIIGHNGQEHPHSGYYWLAYDPENFLLACQRCNRTAKRSQFPIQGTRAGAPEDSLEAERPLLLNPYREQKFTNHFFVPDENTGLLEGKTEEGKKTIEICDLNRETLISDRQEEWGKMKIKLFFKLMDNEGNHPVNDCMQYSLYLKSALETFMEKRMKRLRST